MKMKRNHAMTYTAFALSLVLSLAVAAMISCGGSTTPTTATTGTVNVTISDPLTCGSQLPHIYLTITKVMANIDANAGPSSSGWQPLVDLTSSPMQIDLPSLNPTITCVLKTLGSSGPLPPGKYQQIRLYLLSNNPTAGVQTPDPMTNSCGQNGSNGWNCVDTGSGIVELQLPSEVQTGLKIPSPNITSGGLTVAAGQSVDLDLDIQSCASIVRQGNGKYRLKPVLFAGEVSQDMNSISGQVVDSSTKSPIANATVLFEQHPSGSSDETIMDSMTTDTNGKFFVCPLTSDGSFDIVVTAQTGTTGSVTTYNPTVAFSVPPGTNLGQVPIVPEAVSSAATGGAATILGQVDTSPQVTGGEPVTLTPTMSINSINVIIPVFTVNGSAPTGQPPTVTTTPTPMSLSPLPSTCATGSDCYNFSLTLPASNPSFGTFSGGAITYTPASPSVTTYNLTADTSGCTSGRATVSSIPYAADGTNTISTSPNQLSLSGCTAQ
jgi:Domain of unknown function (DUF4382)/Carboxypeptidase regulatory-like domain